MGDAGKLSLVLRVRQKDKGAIAEACKLVVNAKSPRAERLRLIVTFGEMATAEAEVLLVGLAQDEQDVGLRRAALGALQSYSSAAIGEAVLKIYSKLSGELRSSSEALLASRAGWSLAWMEAVRSGATPFLPISDPFNGALKRPTQKANS
jgi:hypothetical protein